MVALTCSFLFYFVEMTSLNLCSLQAAGADVEGTIEEMA